MTLRIRDTTDWKDEEQSLDRASISVAVISSGLLRDKQGPGMLRNQR